MPFYYIAPSPGSANTRQTQPPAEGSPAPTPVNSDTATARVNQSHAAGQQGVSRISGPVGDLRESHASQVAATEAVLFSDREAHHTLGAQFARSLHSVYGSSDHSDILQALIARLTTASFNHDLENTLGDIFPDHPSDQRNELISGFTTGRLKLTKNIHGEELNAVILPHFSAPDAKNLVISHRHLTDDGYFSFTLNTTIAHQPQLDIQLKRKDLGQRIRNLAAIAVPHDSANIMSTALHEHLNSRLFMRSMMQIINQAIPNAEHRNLSDLISQLPTPMVQANRDESGNNISLHFTPEFSQAYLGMDITRTITQNNFLYAFHLNTVANPPYFSISVREQFIYPEITDIDAERGEEFSLIGPLLQRNPALSIARVNYRSNGVREMAQDAGGPSREFFSNAFRDGVNLITHPSQERPGTRQLPDSLSIDDLAERTHQLEHFGRLLGYIVHQPMINVPELLPYDHLSAVVHLADNDSLPIFHQQSSSKNLNAVIGWASNVSQELASNQALTLHLAQQITPEAFSYYKEALETFASRDHDIPRPLIEQIEEYIPYLTEKSGIDFSAEKHSYRLADDNTLFLQLLLIAQGLAEVKNAREIHHQAIYPSSSEGYLRALCGTGDIRRALCDPHYERHLNIHSEVSFIQARRERILQQLIAKWAQQASDETLRGFCRAVTGSDVLPDHISNRDNRLAIHIKNIGEAEYAVHTCFGTIDLSPHVAWDILKQNHQRPNQIPERLNSIMEGIVSDNNRFNLA